MTSKKHIPGHPVIFGEILFDQFPDGQEVLGGAPFNVAWHLQGFGLAPLMVSRIGKDEKGHEVRQTMAAWGMRTCGVEVDELYPTGRVVAEVTDGQPVFRIEPHQAYDRIEGGPALASGNLDQAGLLYHGTLAVRGDICWRTLGNLKKALNAPTFVDINLRSPWWTQERASACLTDACWAKLSAGELSELTSMDCASEERCVQAANALAQSHGNEYVIVTRGDEGAILVGAGDLRARSDAFPVTRLVDTVGAGDAFSAVTILGFVHGWKPSRILERASRFAAAICAMRGATVASPALYAKHRSEWREAGE
jgi:fructokinase